jgi:endonuclease YncB( thermonuclease family)
MQSREPTTARILRVIDGDTVLTRFVCPHCRTETEQRIRLARIDAPELRGPDHAAAIRSRDHLAQLIEGRVVTVSVCHRHPDRYGRVIAELTIGDINVSNAMLHAEHATRYKLAGRPASDD